MIYDISVYPFNAEATDRDSKIYESNLNPVMVLLIG